MAAGARARRRDGARGAGRPPAARRGVRRGRARRGRLRARRRASAVAVDLRRPVRARLLAGGRPRLDARPPRGRRVHARVAAVPRRHGVAARERRPAGGDAGAAGVRVRRGGRAPTRHVRSDRVRPPARRVHLRPLPLLRRAARAARVRLRAARRAATAVVARAAGGGGGGRVPAPFPAAVHVGPRARQLGRAARRPLPAARRSRRRPRRRRRGARGGDGRPCGRLRRGRVAPAAPAARPRAARGRRGRPAGRDGLRVRPPVRRRRLLRAPADALERRHPRLGRPRPSAPAPS